MSRCKRAAQIQDLRRRGLRALPSTWRALGALGIGRSRIAGRTGISGSPWEENGFELSVPPGAVNVDTPRAADASGSVRAFPAVT